MHDRDDEILNLDPVATVEVLLEPVMEMVMLALATNNVDKILVKVD